MALPVGAAIVARLPALLAAGVPGAPVDALSAAGALVEGMVLLGVSGPLDCRLVRMERR
jgi:hypothetical protein